MGDNKCLTARIGKPRSYPLEITVVNFSVVMTRDGAEARGLRQLVGNQDRDQNVDE